MDIPARDRILDAAEARARAAGYNGFSFRDLAADVGIRSASVHYHFPTKADLGRELADRYTRRAMERLGDPSGLAPDEAAGRVVALFRDALLRDDRMCLCGIFGAERDTLPPEVAEAVSRFFRMLMDFLAAVSGRDGKGEHPAALVARLEGGMVLARALRDPLMFEAAVGGACLSDSRR